MFIPPGVGPRRLTYTATLDATTSADRRARQHREDVARHEPSSIASRRHPWNPRFKGELPIGESAARHSRTCRSRAAAGASIRDASSAPTRVSASSALERYRGGRRTNLALHFATQKTRHHELTDDRARTFSRCGKGDRIHFVFRARRAPSGYLSYMTEVQADSSLTISPIRGELPSLGDNASSFENGGFIHRFDLTSRKGENRHQIKEDFSIGRSGMKDVSRDTTSWNSRRTDRAAVLGARGDFFSVPAKTGPTRNLTQTPASMNRRDLGFARRTLDRLCQRHRARTNLGCSRQYGSG